MSVTRRTVLRGGLASGLLGLSGAGLSACTADETTPGPLPAIDPDVALRAAAVAREVALLQAYDETLLAVPALASRLGPLRADHEAHLTALGGAAPTRSPVPSGSPVLRASAVPSSATGTPAAPAASPLPTEPAARTRAVLTRLVLAERAAAKDHAADALLASRSLAGLLGQAAASEASHPVALA